MANILPRLSGCDTYYFEDLFKMVLNIVKIDPDQGHIVRCDTRRRGEECVPAPFGWADFLWFSFCGTEVSGREPQRLPMTSCIPRKAKSNTETTRITFETIPLRCSGATRLEFRSQRSVIARKGRNRAPMAA